MSCAAACRRSEEECITCILQDGQSHFTDLLENLGHLKKSGKVSTADLLNMVHSIELARDINYQALEKAGAHT